ncbi:TlpA family protein disulfide reductase [Canibacter sp. lx-45]|uniref:TlpA family protein disulfide reductase n=1 Tax=Canibacter zhuwentaonis TaxID=2837491 RepID=UPI001BDC407F|nr:TlpA disulfide reductase family protein [Canibacter zhuwentaonis]MBT1035586.1 TlpA family protein disulfide reductase [Canibacter zhuwentaonis]
MKKRITSCAILTVLVLCGLAGCSAEESLSKITNQNNTGYVAGDGTTVSIPAEQRTITAKFAGKTADGAELTDADFRGSVTVVNFWYAGCAPCRAEATDFAAAAHSFEPENVKFLGVNTRDQAAQATQFEQEFGVPYPSIIDAANGRAVQAAFAGIATLNSTPTTLVLDKEGRVAHRVVGQIAGKSHLETLIKETLQEN